MTCSFWRVNGPLNDPLADFKTRKFELSCGKDKQFDEKVDFIILNMPEVSTLPASQWKIEIPH